MGLCVTGSLSGDLAGDSVLTASSLISTLDTPTTSVVLLTGDTSIFTKRGDLTTEDAIVLRTTAAGDFGEVATIVGGTGDSTGATGQFGVTGTYTAGSGEGEYGGALCSPFPEVDRRHGTPHNTALQPAAPNARGDAAIASIPIPPSS